MVVPIESQQLPFSVELTSKIYDLLVLFIPLKLVRLSHSQYDSLIPSIYKDIKLNSSNADHFRHGIQCIKTTINEKTDKAAGEEEDVLWIKRKCQACSYTETLVLEDESCLMVLDSIVETALRNSLKINLDDLKEEAMYNSKVIFPNLKRIVLCSPVVDLYVSNPVSEDFFKDRIISLKRSIGLGNKIHIDLNMEGITKENFGGFLRMIKMQLDPESLTLKIKPDLFPIQSLYARQMPRMVLFIDIKQGDQEGESEVQREIRRTQSLLRLHFANSNQEKRAVEFYLKSQNLIDIIEGRLSAYGPDSHKGIQIRKWEDDDDWMM